MTSNEVWAFFSSSLPFSLILTDFLCHSLVSLPFSLNLSVFLALRQRWRRLTIHHILSIDDAAPTIDYFFPVLSLSFFFSLYYQSSNNKVSRRNTSSRKTIAQHTSSSSSLSSLFPSSSALSLMISLSCSMCICWTPQCIFLIKKAFLFFSPYIHIRRG